MIGNNLGSLERQNCDNSETIFPLDINAHHFEYLLHINIYFFHLHLVLMILFFEDIYGGNEVIESPYTYNYRNNYMNQFQPVAAVSCLSASGYFPWKTLMNITAEIY